ncbi:hypothetical protein N7474_005223 [Penicillium riverlandense]|uniref:uncharacterized protein n=1 Tax=Penicillium riverlandense TaxID=1903569 RepID=UPI002547A8AE|nr:uncharacterized protein N7474_005223 [Penicillium riverlandense]KAJ5819632.1 hypothetical protein N7474_005223 [Penicillium riverlandense]
MATLRISTTSLSQRAIATCRPRLYLGVRCRSGQSFAPIAKASYGGRKYSTATPALSLAPKVERGGSKLFKDADAAVADIKSGSTILSSGFGLCGVAETLINAMHRRGADQLHSLTAVSNNAGAAGKGGLSTLSQNGQLNRLILSYLGNNKALEKKHLG